MPADFLVAGGFYTLAALAVFGALGVVVSQRVFHNALFLVMALGSVAGVFVVLGADFLAAVELLIYVGAIMVLILFGIMLTGQQQELPGTGGRAQVIGAIVVGAAVFLLTATVIVTTFWPYSTSIAMDIPTIALIAGGLFNVYAFPFELASVLLLVAMIGAIVIAQEP